MALAERLVLLHVGSTAGLLALLALVTVTRRGIEAWTNRGGRGSVGSPVSSPAPSPALEHQVVRVVEPRARGRRESGRGQVTGGLSRSS